MLFRVGAGLCPGWLALADGPASFLGDPRSAFSSIHCSQNGLEKYKLVFRAAVRNWSAFSARSFLDSR